MTSSTDIALELATRLYTKSPHKPLAVDMPAGIQLFYQLTDVMLFGIDIVSGSQQTLFDIAGAQYLFNLLNLGLQRIGKRLTIDLGTRAYCVAITPYVRSEINSWRILDYMVTAYPWDENLELSSYRGIFRSKGSVYTYSFDEA